MKRTCLISTVVGLAILVGGSGVLRAETPMRGYHFFVAPSFDFAVSPEQFTDYYVTGFGIQLGLEYPASANWSLVGSIDYKTFSPAEGMIKDWMVEEGESPGPGATNLKVSEGSLGAVTFAVVSKGMLKKEGVKTYPYIKGGFGLTIAGADEVRLSWDLNGTPGTSDQLGADNATNFSVILGFGIEHETGGGTKAWFVDVGVHMIMVEDLVDPTVIPINFGYKF